MVEIAAIICGFYAQPFDSKLLDIFWLTFFLLLLLVVLLLNTTKQLRKLIGYFVSQSGYYDYESGLFMPQN